MDEMFGDINIVSNTLTHLLSEALGISKMLLCLDFKWQVLQIQYNYPCKCNKKCDNNQCTVKFHSKLFYAMRNDKY